MKIEWLNDDLTECYVVRGWLRKRRAHVVFRRLDKDEPRKWIFVKTGSSVFSSDRGLESWINTKCQEETERRRLEASKLRNAGVWEPIHRAACPEMRLIINNRAGRK